MPHATDATVRGAHRRHGVALLVEFAVVGTVVVIRAGYGEARVEARDGVEERPKARAESVGRRLRRVEVQDLVSDAAVDVLIDHVHDGH